jgi:phosphatidylglycerol---prolipoprotein diacylglyceryl transferase
MYAGRPLLAILGFEGGGLAGLAIHGGLIGGLVGGGIMTVRHRLPFWVMADLYARPLAMGHTLGRIGCFMRGCDYGRLTAGNWGARTMYAAGLRHPSQLYESGLALLLFLGLTWYMRRSRSPGQLFLVYAAGYSVARFTADIYREPAPIAGPLNLAQVVSIVVVIVVGALWWHIQQRSGAHSAHKP